MPSDDDIRTLAERLQRGITGADIAGDVWCSHCDQPAITERTVTDGRATYTAAYCGRCLPRLTIQPRPKEARQP